MIYEHWGGDSDDHQEAGENTVNASVAQNSSAKADSGYYSTTGGPTSLRRLANGTANPQPDGDTQNTADSGTGTVRGWVEQASVVIASARTQVQALLNFCQNVGMSAQEIHGMVTEEMNNFFEVGSGDDEDGSGDEG
jgi:hypothetical protein